MPSKLAMAGGTDRFATLYTNRLFTGLWLQRSPLRDPSQVLYEKYYGGRPDALIAGSNIELTNRLTLARRPGTTAYSVATFSETINSFYSFKQIQNNAEVVTLMVDTPSAVWTLTPAIKTSLYSKGSQSNPYGSWQFSVGNTLYISFNNSTDQPKAWEGGSATIRNWGLATSGSGASTAKTAGTGTQGSATGGSTAAQGPNAVGTGSDYGSGPTGSDDVWSNPSNVTTNNPSTPATVVMGQSDSASGVSNYLSCTNFGFNIPSTAASIAGIEASVIRSPLGFISISDASVLIIQGGTVGGTEHADSTDWAYGINTFTYGSSADLWGLSWAYTDINSSSFGVGLSVQTNMPAGSQTAQVYYVQITVYYTLPSISWTNATNIVGAQGHGSPNYATVVPQTGLNSPSLYATNFGYGLSNNIVGLTVAIYGHVSSSAGSPYLTVQLQDQNSNLIGSAKTVNFTNTSDAAATLGSSTDLWGTSLQTATANNSNFGVSIIATGSSPTFSLNAVTITIYTNAAPGVSGNGSGSLSGTWTYAYSYANTNVVTSNGNPVVSNIVGGSTPVTLASNVNAAITVVASSDSQVNSIILWRTKVSGSTLFYLSSYANSTGTIYDNATNASGTASMADTSLDTTKTAATAFQLTPPPQNLYGQTWYAGRLWGFVGNTLYYASGPDLGNIYGNGNEGWPPANYFTFPSQLTRLVQVTSGLLVFTVSDVWLINGNASAIGITQTTNTTGLTLFNPVPVIFDFGLISPFALDVNGSTIYMLTSDGQGMAIDAGTGLTEIGFPIGAANLAYPNDPSLASFSPKNAYVAWHVSGSAEKAVYFSDGSTGWFRCNPNLPPDGGFVWSPKATISSGCQAVQAIETSPGVHSLLIGPGSGGGSVLVRNSSVFTDNGTAYTASFTMGAIDLAEPGQVADVDFITCDFTRVGTSPVVSILPEELNGTFENISGYVHSDPPALYGATGSPATLYSNRYDLRQSNLTSSGLINPLPVICRHIQIQTSFGTDTVQNEMLSMALFGRILQEK